MLDELRCGVLPEVEEDLGVGEGGAGAGVRGDGTDGGEWLAGAADEDQGADVAFAGYGAAGLGGRACGACRAGDDA